MKLSIIGTAESKEEQADCRTQLTYTANQRTQTSTHTERGRSMMTRQKGQERTGQKDQTMGKKDNEVRKKDTKRISIACQ